MRRPIITVVFAQHEDEPDGAIDASFWRVNTKRAAQALHDTERVIALIKCPKKWLGTDAQHLLETLVSTHGEEDSFGYFVAALLTEAFAAGRCYERRRMSNKK